MTTSGGAKARELLLTVDRWFGGTVSQLVCDHHHRRLSRVGWERVLDPPPGGWAAGESTAHTRCRQLPTSSNKLARTCT
jgi:hypothetical protein